MLMKVTFSESELQALDQARGQIPRATWVRREAVRAAGGRLSPAAEVVQAARNHDVPLMLGSEVAKPPPKIAARHWAP